MFQTRCWAKAAAAFVSIGWVGVSAAATLNVPGDFATIQACIDAAVSGVDECVVAPGTYAETINFLGKAIKLRSSGGADVTTIDATGIGGSVVTCASGEGPDTVLHGFTITGGTGTNHEGYTFGGGMFNNGGNPTVTNCIFSGNAAHVGAGMSNNNCTCMTVIECVFHRNHAARNGGGIDSFQCTPAISGCTFTENTADYGGGGMHNDSSSPTVHNCTFQGNTGGNGGGMRNFYSNPTVSHCTFSSNTADSGAGMHNWVSNPTVTHCIFDGNATIHNGGGMFSQDGAGEGGTTVSNCTFIANSANDTGGGIFSLYNNVTVTDCAFIRNTATNGGGGTYNDEGDVAVTNSTFRENTARNGAGMYNSPYTVVTVTNSTFIANTAYNGGGGIYNLLYSRPTITNCTFHANTATVGGGMFNRYGSPVVTNSIFAGNAAANGGGAMINYSNFPVVTNCILWGDRRDEILNGNEYSETTIRFSDVEGGLPVGAVDGGGNIDLDPMFMRTPDPGPDGAWDGVDDDYGDLRLQAGSPCIDAGDPAFVAQPGETDLEGHARVLCSRVDMGAYEFGIGDYGCDQVVDLTDFANWSTCMLGPSTADTAVPHAPGCEAFDFDADGDVDLLDFAAFQRVLNAP